MKLLFHLFIFIALILVGCENDLDTIKKVTYDPKSPENVSIDLELKYTDSGYAKVQVYAKIAETYLKPEHIMKLKDKVEVKFFNEKGIVTSKLSALYGEINYSQGKMFVKDSVRLENIKSKERLETEELTWNQGDSLIFTDKAVIVKTPGGILFGDGIRTKQDFEYYEFIRPRGKIDFSKK